MIGVENTNIHVGLLNMWHWTRRPNSTHWIRKHSGACFMAGPPGKNCRVHARLKCVRTEGGTSEWFTVQSGIRLQGDPNLFSGTSGQNYGIRSPLWYGRHHYNWEQDLHGSDYAD